MKTVALDAFDALPEARDDLPVPTPGANEVLVRVRASSANPVDNAIAAGMLKGMAEYTFPVVLGRDYSGVVEEVGADVTGYSLGDEVFGFVPATAPDLHEGSWAERIIVAEEAHIAHVPAGVDLNTAGAAPLAAITALASIDALRLTPGESVLIVGASGGVGTGAVQLAVTAGATVIAPAFAEDEAYLHRLGVSDVVPRDVDIVHAVRERYPEGVDALIDLVSLGAPGTYDGAVKDGGRVSSSVNAAGEGPGRTNVMAVPSHENLERVAVLLETGALELSIQKTYDLDTAPNALRDLANGHTQGKLAIRVA
jgi:NADPH:quinone reductase